MNDGPSSRTGTGTGRVILLSMGSPLYLRDEDTGSPPSLSPSAVLFFPASAALSDPSAGGSEEAGRITRCVARHDLFLSVADAGERVQDAMRRATGYGHDGLAVDLRPGETVLHVLLSDPCGCLDVRESYLAGDRDERAALTSSALSDAILTPDPGASPWEIGMGGSGYGP